MHSTFAQDFFFKKKTWTSNFFTFSPSPTLSLNIQISLKQTHVMKVKRSTLGIRASSKIVRKLYLQQCSQPFFFSYSMSSFDVSTPVTLFAIETARDHNHLKLCHLSLDASPMFI